MPCCCSGWAISTRCSARTPSAPRRLLGLALTSRDKGEDAMPMAGFPHPALESTWPRSSRRGCGPPSASRWKTRGWPRDWCKRDVVRIVTPGTLTDDELLDPKTANYLAAVVEAGPQARPGLGRALHRPFFADRPVANRADRRDRPAQPGRDPDLRAEPGCPVGAAAPRSVGAVITTRPSWDFQPEQARKTLFDHFGTTTLAGFGIDDRAIEVQAAGALLAYLRETQKIVAGPHRPADPLSPRRYAGPRRDDAAQPGAGAHPARG